MAPVITRHEPRPCPHCGRELDAAASADGSPIVPRAGDITVCFECGTALMFDEQALPAKLTDERLATLEPGTRDAVAEAQRNIAAYKAAMRGD